MSFADNQLAQGRLDRTIYAHCIDGQADAAAKRITDVLSTQDAGQDPGEEGNCDSEHAA